jgi:predicted O-methyltransferase YrrM
LAHESRAESSGLETLSTITGGPFDLVFIDADKENNAGYLEWAI